MQPQRTTFLSEKVENNDPRVRSVLFIEAKKSEIVELNERYKREVLREIDIPVNVNIIGGVLFAK